MKYKKNCEKMKNIEMVENTKITNELEVLVKETGKTKEEIMSITSEKMVQNHKLLKEIKRLLTKHDFVTVKNSTNDLVISFKIRKNIKKKDYIIIHNIENKARYTFRIKELEELLELGLNGFYAIECSGCEKLKNYNDKNILKNERFL